MTSTEKTMASQSNSLSDPAAESVDQSEWEINPAAIMATKFRRSQSLFRKYVNIWRRVGEYIMMIVRSKVLYKADCVQFIFVISY